MQLAFKELIVKCGKETRTFFVVALLCWILTVVHLGPQALSEDARDTGAFFPVGVFGRVDSMTAHWYKAELTALSEPSLFAARETKGAHVYRFLWVRTFHHPVSVRLIIYPAGSGSIVTKISDGAGGYNPGNLILDKTTALSGQQVHEVLERLDAIGFWSMKATDYDEGNFRDEHGTHVEAHSDGAQWILEEVKDGTYHVVDRWSPGSPGHPPDKIEELAAYARLCKYLLELGNVKEDNVY
jgi:hypothetical protein